MRTRIRRHVSFANVMSVIAVFLLIGGGAYAAKKINGKTIKNNSIPASKLKKDVLTGLDRCPSAAPTNLGGLCHGPAQADADFDIAVATTCPNQGLRLPTVGEAILITKSVGGQTWTDQISAPTNAVIVAGGNAPNLLAQSTPIPFRCVTNATN
jgi:hypothetical protein